jgi:hypothetical protein
MKIKINNFKNLFAQGYTVVGVEGVLYIVEDFFKENSLDHEKVPVPEVNGWLFKVSNLE